VIGLPAMFYTHGVGAFFFLGSGVILTPLVIYIYGFKLRKAGENFDKASPVFVMTLPYKSKALSRVVSVVTVSLLTPYLILQLSGVGKFMVSYSDGLFSYTSSLVITAVMVLIYMWNSGAKSDAITDFYQGIFTLVGSLLLGILILIKLDSNFFVTLKDANLMSIPGPNGFFSLPFLFSYAIIFGLICIATPQVSAKIMASDEKSLKVSSRLFPFAGLAIIALGGLFGLYAAANLDVISPDFVVGDVLQSLLDLGGILAPITICVSLVFIVGVIAAAISTIDSLLLAITAMLNESIFKEPTKSVKVTKIWIFCILIVSIFFSFKPPAFIVDLARIQVGGLMGLLPCLLAPFHGYNSKFVGWMSLIFGVSSIVVMRVWNPNVFGLDSGVVNLVVGSFGVFIGIIVEKIFNSSAVDV
jgi:SSS family solute:Na+ symporter